MIIVGENNEVHTARFVRDLLYDTSANDKNIVEGVSMLREKCTPRMFYNRRVDNVFMTLEATDKEHLTKRLFRHFYREKPEVKTLYNRIKV